jgi:YidC/Oxa1 family membrane protein insertase
LRVSQLWNTIIFQPLLNLLLFLYALIGRNFGLAVILFTVLVRVATLPFTMQQMRSAKASQDMQPKLAELQQKYKNDKEKLAQEQMKLYKESGVNPLGCLVPTLIQLPIWFGLYQSITAALPQNPLQLLNLARHIYVRFPFLSNLLPASMVPLNPKFLWLNLGRPDPYYIIPILTVASMWLQQKMMAAPNADPQQQAMSQSMELMMPLMFGWITLSMASGLGLYFVATNVVGVVQQYFTSGWGSLATLLKKPSKPTAATRRKGKSDERTKKQD